MHYKVVGTHKVSLYTHTSITYIEIHSDVTNNFNHTKPHYVIQLGNSVLLCILRIYDSVGGEVSRAGVLSTTDTLLK